MRVLDIDMDFFLNKIEYLKPFDGIRLSDDEFYPWEKKKIETFLEVNCGLNKEKKVKGNIFDEHGEVFSFIKDKIDCDEISLPLEWVHVDAHADLGFGDSSWVYIFKKYLKKQKNERPNILEYNDSLSELERLGSGNYLLYMIACEWLKNLKYVTHPESKANDFNIYFMKDFDEESGYIQLKYFPDGIKDIMKVEEESFLLQPEVKFDVISCYNAYIEVEEFDYLVFSKSLSYTPESADFIVDIIMEYMDIID